MNDYSTPHGKVQEIFGVAAAKKCRHRKDSP